MIAMRNIVCALFHHFRSSEDGAVLTEALVAVPFVTLFAAGVLEFGNIFWQRMQIDSGLRDAGRYMSRCRPRPDPTDPTCDETAKKLAFYGTQASGAALRVPGWGDNLADITIIPVDVNGTITVQTSHLYRSSPIFSWLGIDAITITSSHQERYIGW
ncbi:TadE/TadG family type IV pilus assembly protein [Ensifer adhaerens]|uniref:TadE/TadG family type IV pilus assembly protein n=1 Tax=Ensifer adhaerens TaxID=106592 RepID=UPI0008073C4E|nr:TadE/TadG family type IV pilus assembly protein [Ensifer adhaerens]